MFSKKIKVLFKKVICISSLAMVMVSSLSGCSGKKDDVVYTAEEASTTKVMNVGDYEINLDEALVYSLQYIYMQGTTSDSLDDVTVESSKSAILDNIRQVKLMYDVAVNNSYELSQEDVATVDQTVKNCKTLFTQEMLDEYGISDEVLTKVFTEQYTVERYSEYIKHDMSETILADIEAAYKDYQFVVLSFIRFPTVEVDEQDAPKVDENGEYVYLSESEKEEVKKNAEEALEKLRDGTDYDQVIAEYGIAAYCYDNTGYIGGYSDELNAQLETMKAGDCSEIMEDSLGYGIVYMKEIDDGTLKQTYVEVQANEVLESEFATLQQRWLSTISIDPVNDMEGTTWADFDLKLFVENMEKFVSQ